MRTYGNTDSSVLLNLSTGLPMPGVQVLVWDAETGGNQVTTGLLATDGTTPLPGYVVSGVDGSFGHKEAGTADARWYSTATDPGRRWYAEAHEALAGKASPADIDTKITAERAVSNSTYALKAEVAGAKRMRPRVALLGDSISNQDGDISGATVPFTSGRGYLSWANVLLNGVLTKVYNTATDDEFGTSGQTTANIVGDTLPGDDLTAAKNADTDLIIVHAGTNDVGAGTSAATIAANLQAIWDALIASGKTVVATTILPRNSGSDTAAMRQALVDANRLIRANASNTRGVILCDWYPALMDAATGLAKTAYFADGIHPNGVGASRMGKVLADVLAPLFPGYVTPALSMSTTDAGNILAANGLMAGTTGTANAPATGQVAAGWNVYVDGTPTSVTASKVARADLFPGEWQQIVCAAVAPATDGYHLQYQNTNVGVDWAVGDTIRAAAEFQTDAAGWDVRAMHLAVFCYNNTGTASGLLLTGSEISALTVPLNRPPSGVIKTPSIVVPTGTTRVQVQFWQKGSGTVRVGRVHLLRNV